jgi:hypothetical protein
MTKTWTEFAEVNSLKTNSTVSNFAHSHIDYRRNHSSNIYCSLDSFQYSQVNNCFRHFPLICIGDSGQQKIFQIRDLVK